MDGTDQIRNDGTEMLCQPTRVERIKDYVSRNLAQDLSIDTVSEKFGLTASTFRHAFTIHEKQGYREYVEQLRMAKALDLLKEGKWIKEVMAATGYKNRATFNNAFKRKYQQPARNFRR